MTLLGACENSLMRWKRKSEADPMCKKDQCELCILFEDQGCIGCPVYEHTGKTGCKGTPFDAFYKAMQNNVENKTLKRLAKAKYDFLLKVLTPVIKAERAK